MSILFASVAFQLGCELFHVSILIGLYNNIIRNHLSDIGKLHVKVRLNYVKVSEQVQSSDD